MADDHYPVLELQIKGAWHRLSDVSDLGGADLLFHGPAPEYLRVLSFDPTQDRLVCLGGKHLDPKKVWDGIASGRITVQRLVIPPF